MKRDKVLRKRILLAEDQQDVREMTAMLLGIDEHVVTEAVNGQEALGLFTGQPSSLGGCDSQQTIWN